MFCSYCGTIISADQKKCPICGTVNEAPIVTEAHVETPKETPVEAPATFTAAPEAQPAVTMAEESPYANYVPENKSYEAEYNRIVADANIPKKDDATSALVFGIISLVIPIFFCGLWLVFPLMMAILSVVSLIMAILAMKKAKPFKNYPNVAGAGSANIGKILAIVGLVLSIINLVLYAIALLFLIGYIVIIFLIMMLPTLMYI